MLDRLLHALIQSKNEAADDVLLEALRLGAGPEKQVALRGLMRRKTVGGLSGVIGLYDSLPDELRLAILSDIKVFHHALRESGRSDQLPVRLAALKLIALGRQGKLAYVLSENLHSSDEAVSKAATEALVALARWVSLETRALQRGAADPPDDGGRAVSGVRIQGTRDERTDPASRTAPSAPASASLRAEADAQAMYRDLLDQRPEIEATVARALDVHRGRHGADLLRAALLLCDWPGSKTLAILHSAKHGGKSPLVRRLQQPPASEHVEAFLLGASHGQLRSHFGIAFAHIDEAPVLDALLRKTHWLKDHNLQISMHQVARGAWWGESELQRDIERRNPEDAARIADWIAASACADTAQDERLGQLRQHVGDSFPARLRIFRAASRRKQGASVGIFRRFLDDSDERLVRLAAREIVRRRPADFENMLLNLMTNSSDSVRRVVSRAIGQSGFDNFWQRFDRLDKATRKQAGRAMFKILPDALQRLQRRLAAGPMEQRLKAMQMAHELELGEPLKETILQLCSDANPRLRSKAVAMSATVPGIGAEALVERLINDPDARVRANTVEVLEQRQDMRFISVLAQRARSAHSRERANAIKALHRLRITTITQPLLMMLRDPRSEHRISAMWTLRQIGWWQLLGEVGQLARSDADLRVRRYALGMLRGVADLAQAAKAAQKAG
jgi:HEAT repeat protein